MSPNDILQVGGAGGLLLAGLRLGGPTIGKILEIMKSSNGHGSGNSDVLAELRQINTNTAGIPDAMREAREFMRDGREAFSTIERIERQVNAQSQESRDLTAAVEGYARSLKKEKVG